MPNQLYTTAQSGFMYEIFYNQPWRYTGSVNSPTGIFIGLTSIPPTNTSITELAVSNYARQPMGTGTVNWSYPYANSGLMVNRNQVNFPVAAASWGWVSGAFLADDGYAGNVLFFATLGTPKEITTNDQFYIPQSGCTVRMS